MLYCAPKLRLKDYLLIMTFRKFSLKIIVVLVVTYSLIGCSTRESRGYSRATGINLDHRNSWSKEKAFYKEQGKPPGMVFIEGGTFTKGKVQDDIMHDWNNTPSQQHVQSYYMDETEVTNGMWMEYLDYIKKVFPPSNPNYRNIYIGALPDTLVWRNQLGYNEVMVDNYLRHPAFFDYPVVGVSWVQAVEYSEWRTDVVNMLALQKAGYISLDAINIADSGSGFDTQTFLDFPHEAFGGKIDSLLGKRARPTKTDSIVTLPGRGSGILFPEYRLPTEVEWEYAALALTGIREYNNYRGKKKYPWNGEYTRSGKRRSRGDQLANFKQGSGDYGGIAGWSDDGGDVTVPVKSYPPNDLGLYDMAGNVAEWVADVYRPIIDEQANDFNYYRGNVYYKNKIGVDGKPTIVTEETIQYDTLSNGRIVARGLPGELAQVPIDDSDTYLRTNFSVADNRNYRDGDKNSTRYFDRYYDDTDQGRKMYNSPKHKVYKDSDGKLIREYDKSSSRTSLINDEVRVYKGGSWRDRAYWLDPAQRRYLPQYMATDYIGFRCAMSRVGSKSKLKKRARN